MVCTWRATNDDDDDDEQYSFDSPTFHAGDGLE
jgi:hypothetical protein